MSTTASPATRIIILGEPFAIRADGLAAVAEAERKLDLRLANGQSDAIVTAAMHALLTTAREHGTSLLVVDPAEATTEARALRAGH